MCVVAESQLQRAKNEYYIALFHPDDGSIEAWRAEASVDKMRAEFADYELRCVPPCIMNSTLSCVDERGSPKPDRIRKLLDLAPSTLRWRLVDRKPLKTWIHPSSRVVLLGDSCHPMLVSTTIVTSCSSWS